MCYGGIRNTKRCNINNHRVSEFILTEFNSVHTSAIQAIMVCCNIGAPKASPFSGSSLFRFSDWVLGKRFFSETRAVRIWVQNSLTVKGYQGLLTRGKVVGA